MLEKIKTIYSKWKKLDACLKILLYIVLAIVVDGLTGFHVIKFILGAILLLIFGLLQTLPILTICAARDITE
jgi:hypothetical protein